MKILKSADTHNLVRRSSITQHTNLLGVMRKGEWCPLVADVIDYVKCNHIHSHKAAVATGDTLGYTFPVKNCRYVSDLYLMGDEDHVALEPLPTWFGTGFYETHRRERVFLNADNGALGLHQVSDLRVGLDYVVAKKTLPAK